MKPRKTASSKREEALRRNLTPEEYKALSAPGSAELPRQTPKPRKAASKPLPLNFLLGCPKQDLEDFELARLAEVSDLRKELHATMDRVIDAMSQAALVAWFKEQDRQALKHAIENEESPLEWAKRMIRDGQRSESELLPLPSLPPGAAHLAAALRYQERNIAKGKCQNCPESLAPGSVRYCEKHLAMERHRDARKRGVKGEPGTADYLYGEITESTHGRQLGTFQSLALSREKKTREVLAQLGVKPEDAAVTLRAVKEALLRVMPDSKAKALSPAELFQAATVPSKTTGNKALAQLLAAGKVRRIEGHPCRYFLQPIRG